MSLDHACQSGQHRHAERGVDLYETPACAVEALLAVENLPRAIWEPAAGRGAIANVLRDRGHAHRGWRHRRPARQPGRDGHRHRQQPVAAEPAHLADPADPLRGQAAASQPSARRQGETA